MTAASDAPAGMMYTRFHVTVFVLAALLVWGRPIPGPSRPGSPLRAPSPRSALLALSILMMWTQTANPFLYFQF